MRLSELIPGDKVTKGGQTAIFIGRINPHPIYPGLSLAIWFLENETYSFDALHPHQDIGALVYDEFYTRFRVQNLQYAFSGGKK